MTKPYSPQVPFLDSVRTADFVQVLKVLACMGFEEWAAVAFPDRSVSADSPERSYVVDKFCNSPASWKAGVANALCELDEERSQALVRYAVEKMRTQRR